MVGPMGEEAVDARVLAAQSRRDRGRVLAAEAESAELRARLAALQGLPAPARLARLAARRLVLALPPRLRDPLVSALRPRVPGPVGEAAPPRPVSLVLDAWWPRPDRDSGSVDTVNLLRALRDLGHEVHYAAAEERGEADPAAEALRREGIGTWAPPPGAAPDAVARRLAELGPRLDLLVLCRLYCGGGFLETAQAVCRRARLVFNTVDLCHLREERRARLTGDETLLAAAEEMRRREQHVARSCDATVVVSAAEREMLARSLPEALVVELPLARPLAPPVNPFAARRGIGFVGGFAHAPNADAVRHFLDAVWPRVLERLPEAEFGVAGPDRPSGLVEGRPGRVVGHGHLPDLGPWFESLRLTVAPLRYGAGAKGKVASSLAAGVPVVATPVAAEGMGLGAESGVLVAEDPAAFAEAVVALHEDEALWRSLSAGGLSHAGRALSPESWNGRLAVLLDRIGLPAPAPPA